MPRFRPVPVVLLIGVDSFSPSPVEVNDSPGSGIYEARRKSLANHRRLLQCPVRHSLREEVYLESIACDHGPAPASSGSAPQEDGRNDQQ